VFIVIFVFIECSVVMNNDGEKAIGESYWSCYRRSRNKTEADMQLLSTELHEGVCEESVCCSDAVICNSNVTEQPDFGSESFATAAGDIADSCMISQMQDDDESCSDESDFETCFDSDSDIDDTETVKPDTDSCSQSLADKLANWSASCDIPLDPMHLLYLGVVRRIVLSWIRGSYCVRLSQSLCSQLSDILLNMRSYIPRDFCRRPRSLAEIDRWKATEFRLFLLYTGPIAIKNFVSDNVYKHFLLLSVASFILSSSELCVRYCDYAESLLKLFVSNTEKIYGKDMLVYNVHGLLHLADDVRRYGPLERFSAFPFENKLKNIKKLVRKPSNPLQQVIRRLSERQANSSCETKPRLHPETPRFEHNKGPVVPGVEDARQFTQMVINDQVLAVNKNDSCVVTVDDTVCMVYNVLKLNCKYALVVKRFTKIENFFHYPLPSAALGIVKASHLCTDYNIISVDDVCRKCVIIPSDDNTFIVFPLLHQFPC